MSRTSETPMSQDHEIAGLVQCAIKGDTEAFGRLYEICLDRIYRYVFYQTRNTMLSEDITEEVFIKAWKAIHTCQGKEETFVAWLYRIAHNHTVDVLRKSPPSIPLDSIREIEGGDAAGIAEISMEWQQVLKIIDTLPEQQKQLLILKFMNGSENCEIEQVMGKRPGALRVLQMRALKNLKKRWNSAKGLE